MIFSLTRRSPSRCDIRRSPISVVERCLVESPANTRSAALPVGEKACLCVDTNCHSKWITVPVTVVLGLSRQAPGSAPCSCEPAPNEVFLRRCPFSGLRYIHFGKCAHLVPPPLPHYF